MMAAMVVGLLLLMLAVVVVWLLSPRFRSWTERPKYQMLEGEALFNRAQQQDEIPSSTSDAPSNSDRQLQEQRHD